jgi:hypothetical protein
MKLREVLLASSNDAQTRNFNALFSDEEITHHFDKQFYTPEQNQ